MKIIAHRGYWNTEIANNSPQALRMALERGYGIESDIRDYQGALVISHNIADETCQVASELFRWLREFGDHCCFAINIKADGLKDLLMDELRKNQIENYFAFDMSVPQMIEYATAGIRFFTRQSEVETNPVLYEQAAGVWIDGFWNEEWITEKLLRRHIQNDKTVCIVSPELHGRAYEEFWTRLHGYEIDFNKILLCTDKPEEAVRVFQDKLAGVTRQEG